MAVEELGVGEFFFLNFNVARDVACHKTYHQVAGEGPGLAGKVTYVVDLETCFFHHLAAHTLLEALSCFYKTCHKTVVVAVIDNVRHPLYKKIVKRTVKFKAHDEQNACGIGDTVMIMETRPISKDKRWRVVEIIEKAK